ncbi:hypothetical protein PG988_015114 [Apiospora saccharicola]
MFLAAQIPQGRIRWYGTGSLSVLGHKRSNSATSATPSDQRLREEKSASYRDTFYETLLNMKGIHMETAEVGITVENKAKCWMLLEGSQAVPYRSVFDDTFFENACKNKQKANEAMIIQDISRLMCSKESVNEGWNNSIPLTGTRPQPDYCVGFCREAFTADQLAKLSSFIGNFLTDNLSFFMAPYYIYFSFVACEVKCGVAAGCCGPPKR